MAQVAAQRHTLTADELADMSFPDSRTELVGGEVIQMAPAGGEHGVVAMRIGARLLAFVEAGDLGLVCAAETGFLVARDPDTVRAPDAAFISKERLSGNRPPKKFWPFAPDLAVEVVSPSETGEQLQERIQDWLFGGAQWVWVIYPGVGTVHVYRSPSEVRVLQRGDVLEGEGTLSGFRCPVENLFL